MKQKNQINQAIREFIDLLKQNYKDVIQEVILFGSFARGEYDEESDVDILIVIKNGDRQLQDEISMSSFDLIMKNDVILSPLVMDKETYRWHKRYRDPLYNNIKKDGIDIWTKKPGFL